MTGDGRKITFNHYILATIWPPLAVFAVGRWAFGIILSLAYPVAVLLSHRLFGGNGIALFTIGALLASYVFLARHKGA